MLRIIGDEELKDLATLLDKSRTTVIADNYATLASFYLPAASAFEVDPALVPDKALMAKSSSMCKLVDRTLDVERSSRYLTDNMPEIFASVLKQINVSDTVFTGNGSSSLQIIRQTLPTTSQKLATTMIQ